MDTGFEWVGCMKLCNSVLSGLNQADGHAVDKKKWRSEQPLKAHMRKYPHWDDQTTKELILEGWAEVSQSFINKLVKSMPDRLKAVIETEGKLTGY